MRQWIVGLSFYNLLKMGSTFLSKVQIDQEGGQLESCRKVVGLETESLPTALNRIFTLSGALLGECQIIGPSKL